MCTYRTVSLFGFRIWTAIDSVDSAPVIGAGSRDVTASQAWVPITLGTLPLVFIAISIYSRRRRHGRDPSVVAKIEDEVQKSTAPNIQPN